ncbi:hypothetical protein HELRODRAFT_165055 [Helobdella robusta]|uniref:EGF-like domain-containing protein n=1 Tax=Helobdella robusta TaxID=6412 RepID=T1EW78_HELRO|nr:hypothetical protein HELRODRAFT_165055 [Helobdella robusta]ESN92919.1 hypothetical protein HELRODRAFT_165055 [Helobdella robusta]
MFNLFSCDLSGQFCQNLVEITDTYLTKKGCIDGITIENGKISWMQTAIGTIFSGQLEVPNDDVESHDYTNTNDSEYEGTLDDNKILTEHIKNVHVIRQSPYLLGFTYLRNRLIWIDQNRLHVASDDSTPDDFVKTILINDNVKFVSMITANISKKNHNSLCSSKKPFCSDVCVTSYRGKRRCLCPQGYVLRYGYLCIKDRAPCFFRQNGLWKPVCSDVCHQVNKKHFNCSCNPGRTLLADRKTCTGDFYSPSVYLGSSQALIRVSVDNELEKCEKIENIQFNELTSMTFDPITFSIFFSDRAQNKISNGPNDSSNVIDRYNFKPYNNDDNYDSSVYKEANYEIGLIHLETSIK